MTANNPELIIPRQSVVGMEGMFVKMWDPPTESPSTPDLIQPTNPVPEVMAQASLQSTPRESHTVQRDLLHGAKLEAYDGKEINFFLFRDANIPATGSGNFPGATIRVPRGVWFHGEVQGHGPPPHTIHWHGIEPTPINDGVGHCSMEVGHYTYQWQPNFIGFYFCHCHRNTVQHFEFGLYQALLIDPPDAYFATQWNRAIPLGAGRDGLRRIAANLNIIGTETAPGSGVPGSGAGYETLVTRTDAQVQALWPGYVGGLITDLDPERNNATLPAYLKFPVHPHAKTVPYDVEALWVVDDRDSNWSDNARDARITYPKRGSMPGVDDNFHGNAGGGTDSSKFFAFNDFRPDYWYVTGVNFPGPKLSGAVPGSNAIAPDIVIPPELICGTPTQVSIAANVGQTILVRLLDAAYNNITARFPVDVTVIAWDGRALGVEPFNAYNHAYVVPANTPIHSSVARRFDALIKVDQPVFGYAEIDFTDTRCGTADGAEKPVLFTGRIPINIGYGLSGRVTNNQNGFGIRDVTIIAVGGPVDSPVTRTTVTDELGNWSIAGLPAGSYTVTATRNGQTFAPTEGAATLPGAGPVNFTGTQDAGFYTISGVLFESRRGGAITGVVAPQGQRRRGRGQGNPGEAATPGVTVNLTGGALPAPVAVTADSEGRFEFTGLENGDYVVTPVSTVYAFRPQSRTVTINGANRSVNFRGSLTLLPVTP